MLVASGHFPPMTVPVNQPKPPKGVTVDFEDRDFLAMRNRYETYLKTGENLTGTAYFCLTCLDDTTLDGKKIGRKKAAKVYEIPFHDLSKVGKLTGQKGGLEGARKARGIDNALTDIEKGFLIEMVKLMMRKRGELAAVAR